MSEPDTVNLRLDNLEDFRAEQLSLNKSILEALHRIELGLQSARDKACPLPGHCVVLESTMKEKYSADVLRFSRLETRIAENDAWRKEIEGKIDSLKTTLNRGLGAVGLLTVAMPLLTWFIINHLVNR
jgi:hypothetical protein